jgi:hypothetical protein
MPLRSVKLLQRVRSEFLPAPSNSKGVSADQIGASGSRSNFDRQGPTKADRPRPQYLWIGWSDSRVPANQLVGLLPSQAA